MNRLLRVIVIGLLFASLTAGCAGSASGDEPKPASSSSQDDSGGNDGY